MRHAVRGRDVARGGGRPVSRRPSLRALALAFPLLVAGGCISDEREQEIGNAMAAEVNPHLPLIEEPLLVGYLQSMGEQLVSVTDRPEIDYSFYIIDTDIVNAFALPGGHVYVTRGLVQRTVDGPEFAGVLAHEIAHVAARHGARKLQRHLRTGSLVNVMYNTILGGEPAILRENSLQMAEEIWSARHSRRDEKEADRLAVKYLLRTGVDPHAVVRVLEGLLEEERAHADLASGGGAWFSTHPMTENRIRDVRRHIVKLAPANPPETELNVEGFEAFRLLVASTGFLPPSHLGH
jgi:beta-barrel assembly-enhancing protease